jgi:DNA-directed RNA polymerase subunit RPC12/RpoP
LFLSIVWTKLQYPEKKYTCENPKCKHTFDKPTLVQYYVCPFCSTKIEKETAEVGCLHYFGYLRDRKSGEVIPSECIECKNSVDCMLTNQASKQAVKEIKKWYQ